MQRRDSTQIEVAALEAINKAIATGFIDVRREQSESVAERLYMLLNQYEEELADLRTQLLRAQLEIESLREELDNTK
jgi:hypothetical protein